MSDDRSGVVRRLHVDDFSDDPNAFFDRIARDPVIVQGIVPNGTTGPTTFDELRRRLSGTMVFAIESATQQHRAVLADDLFDGVLAGDRRYNVVDHAIAGTPLADLFPTPGFLGDNWLTTLHVADGQYAKSLVISPAGASTPLHVDSYGLSGWMYLVEGRKHWTLYPPWCRQALFEPMFKTWYDDSSPDADSGEIHAGRYPFARAAAAERRAGTLDAGELLYFPAGWIHSVRTSAASAGFGGSVLNASTAMDAMQVWLIERSNHEAGSLDFKSIYERMRASARPRDREAADRALALCAAWEAQMIAHGQD